VLTIEPFHIAVAPDVLADLRDRIARTRWPDEPPEPGWAYGTETPYLRGLLDAWHDFDWPAFEQRLNGLPHYRARIGDQQVHFVHARGTGPDPLPIVLTHGWPGSFLEHLDLIPLLTQPDDPADAFDVVVPSLPGYGFSARPARPGTTNAVVADLWQRLMTEGLGYQRFAAHGTDIGAGITSQLGLRHPDQVAGIHLSAFALPPPPEPWSEGERRYFTDLEQWAANEGAYMHQHRTKPQTLGYGLTDSPAGMAGWITEKYRDWSDSHGDLEARIGRDRFLATLTLYWATGTIASSIRMYYENRHHGTPLTTTRPVTVPAGFALFPHEFQPVPKPPRELAERYFQVVHWRELPRGGHFPATEEPQLLAEEIRAFFRPLRGS
jgi:pimeloyl-ACP methyl ester carboxylesterase